MLDNNNTTYSQSSCSEATKLEFKNKNKMKGSSITEQNIIMQHLNINTRSTPFLIKNFPIGV